MKLFERLSGTQGIEFNNLHRVVAKDDVAWKHTRYMLGWVTDTTKRNADDDIKKKCYLFVDIDVRSHIYETTGEVINDDRLFEEIDKIILTLTEKWFWGFAYAIHSGNGLHLYYIGDEIVINKIDYSHWVQYFYSLINTALSKLWYVCDPACHNIARISRVPWSINQRKKEKSWKIIWDLWDMECTILIEQQWDPKHYNWIIDYALQYMKEQSVTETVIKQTKQEFKANKDDMRAEINKIDILPIVMDTRWLDWFKDRGDIITLRDSKRNIGAYVYKPNNCVVTTGTSRAKAGKETYTTYEFVLDEICNGNTKALKEYFETKHNILFPNDKKKFLDISIPNKTYFKDIGYYYGGEIFDEEFQVLRSGELVVIASPTNLWKSTFTQKILERNKDKKSLYINFEFDLERWYEDSRKKKKWFQVKKKWTDLDPYTELELAEMRSYVEACKKKIEIQNLEQGEKLEKVVDLILQHIEKWYSLFAIDTFSSIEWADNWETQNLITRKLHEITKKTWACIIAVHHFNKTGAKMSGSQKISDLANVVIAIEYKDFWSKEWSVFSLLKDKGIYWIKTVECYFENWNYLSTKYL